MQTSLTKADLKEFEKHFGRRLNFIEKEIIDKLEAMNKLLVEMRLEYEKINRSTL